MSDIRTRFAPSPTGYLHIGGARTALYNWLYARKTGGQFLLRVEDTDKARSTDENTRAIFEGLKWLGLHWDNPKPMLQSERTAVYVEHVERLLSQGKAYRCYCTAAELDAKRKAAEAEKRSWRYDRTCRNRASSGDLSSKAGFPFVVRAAFDLDGDTVIDDQIKGVTRQANSELSDEVILRADGSPLYNLCVVIDDVEMKITHVLRGDDHLNNTFKQIQLYKAFGYDLPKFGHMPLIFDSQGKKVSKRSGTVVAEVHRYQEMGYLPEAMMNFLARLGWSLGEEAARETGFSIEKEEFTTEELIKAFSIAGIGKAAARFDIKRLDNLNGTYLRQRSTDSLIEEITPRIRAKGWTVPERPVLEGIIAATRARSQTLQLMVDQVAFLFVDEPAYDPKAVEKNLKGKGAMLGELDSLLAGLTPFDGTGIEAALKEYANTHAAGKLGDVAGPLRVALTGGSVSPPIHDVITLLGKAKVASRLAKAKGLAA